MLHARGNCGNSGNALVGRLPSKVLSGASFCAARSLKKCCGASASSTRL